MIIYLWLLDEEDDEVGDFGSASKKRRMSKGVRVRKSTTNRYHET